MIIQTIYDTYNIPAHLQLHMLRVAAIVQNICQEWKTQNMDVQQLITVALLHDLGNIVKFNMTLYPTVWEPE
jgi:HD-GYP domain-containing protein (c-di-GMP phosphodiesterase class II)